MVAAPPAEVAEQLPLTPSKQVPSYMRTTASRESRERNLGRSRSFMNDGYDHQNASKERPGRRSISPTTLSGRATAPATFLSKPSAQ